ncbi:MAG: NAD(P)/FAD-dependent oxidoreductase [Archangium sp.]|nr:NAD(P)/FAD-dependent oxidoreductase [Archangium sp.]
MNDFDVIIVGAGLSGIGAAWRLQQQCPGLRYAVLEGRASLGGTWDLFRYPGVRSDSDMFTLGYPFRPWKGPRALASGAEILEYVRETAQSAGIDRHIRFRHRVKSAAWSSAAQRWVLEVEADGKPTTLRARFLHLCVGYYSYERAHQPRFEGLDEFRGQVVHPQWWPESLDVSGKRVVVIGSGATAVTLVPELARTAAHVTMLQRSPTWYLALPGRDRLVALLRRLLPATWAHLAVRTRNVLLATAFFQFCRRFPRAAARLLERGVRRHLPGRPLAPDFTPRYAPWDQRVCVVPDGDLFTSIRDGRASVVTDAVERFTERGVRLSSGRGLDADIVVTATGLELLALGGIELQVDGRRLVPSEQVVYRGLMFADVPNLSWCVGYTNASWTLRADLAAQYLCRLINHMQAAGFTSARPDGRQAPEARRPLLELSSGYVARAAPRLPSQGDAAPWTMRQNYLLDWRELRFAPVDEAMQFEGQTGFLLRDEAARV